MCDMASLRLTLYLLSLVLQINFCFTQTTNNPTTLSTLPTTSKKPSSGFIVPSKVQKPVAPPGTKLNFITPSKRSKDCSEIYLNGYRLSTTYKIYPFDDAARIDRSVYAYCDLSDGTGWTVIQSRGMRGNLRDSFNQNYSSYVSGFGSTCSDHWIGLETINALTASDSYEITINGNGILKYPLSWGNYSYQTSYASNYRFFSVGNQSTGYALHTAGYKGNAGDFLSGLNGTTFLTQEMFAKNCSDSPNAKYSGPWWYSMYSIAPANFRYCSTGSNTFNNETLNNTGLPAFGYVPLTNRDDTCNSTSYCFSFLPQTEIRIRNPFAIYGYTRKEVLALVEQYKSYPRDCAEVYLGGNTSNTVYLIYPWGNRNQSAKVYCENGYTYLLKRGDINVNYLSQREDFSRNWTEYENGFGQFCGDSWLGLRIASALTSVPSVARIDLGEWTGYVYFIMYNTFAIGPASSGYQLTIGNVSDTYYGIGDSLGPHNGAKFSTSDVDNDSWDDGSCAQAYNGGWWYQDCFKANLNGEYINLNDSTADGRGIIWSTWKGANYSLRYVTLKVTRLDFNKLQNMINAL